MANAPNVAAFLSSSHPIKVDEGKCRALFAPSNPQLTKLIAVLLTLHPSFLPHIPGKTDLLDVAMKFLGVFAIREHGMRFDEWEQLPAACDVFEKHNFRTRKAEAIIKGVVSQPEIVDGLMKPNSIATGLVRAMLPPAQDERQLRRSVHEFVGRAVQFVPMYHSLRINEKYRWGNVGEGTVEHLLQSKHQNLAPYVAAKKKLENLARVAVAKAAQLKNASEKYLVALAVHNTGLKAHEEYVSAVKRREEMKRINEIYNPRFNRKSNTFTFFYSHSLHSHYSFSADSLPPLPLPPGVDSTLVENLRNGEKRI